MKNGRLYKLTKNISLHREPGFRLTDISSKQIYLKKDEIILLINNSKEENTNYFLPDEIWNYVFLYKNKVCYRTLFEKAFPEIFKEIEQK
jgi:hypothetical protein